MEKSRENTLSRNKFLVTPLTVRCADAGVDLSSTWHRRTRRHVRRLVVPRSEISQRRTHSTRAHQGSEHCRLVLLLFIIYSHWHSHCHSPTPVPLSPLSPQLCSTHANVLTVSITNTRLGDRSFSVAGPRIWNSLFASLRQPDTELGHFKRLLKAFLFGETAAH